MWRKNKALTVEEFWTLAEDAANTGHIVLSSGLRECLLSVAYVDDDGCLVLQGDPCEDELSISEVIEISRDADPDAAILIEGAFGKLHEAEGVEVSEEWNRTYIF